MRKWLSLIWLCADGILHGHRVRRPYWSPFGVWLCCCAECDGWDRV